MAVEQLTKIVRDGQANPDARRSALESLTESRAANVKQLAQEVLKDQNVVHQAVVTILRLGNVEDAKALIDIYPDRRVYRPGVADLLLSGLAGRRDLIPLLFDAVESKKFDPDLVDASLLRQIQLLDDSDFQTRLEKLWPQTKRIGGERLSQILALEQKLTPEVLASASLGRGRAIWDKTCASCHKLFGEGGVIGPELTAPSDRTFGT